MRQIKKGKEPNSLTEHRHKAHADYENYPEKDELRNYLCKEQRGICCYCMSAIFPENSKMKIEHFKCQERHPDLQLEYWNLLGSCLGNLGQPEELTHCDNFKGSKEFSYNPINQLSKIEDYIWYNNDGTIGSSIHDLDHKINRILNLNVLILKKNRKAALDGFKVILNKKHKGQFKRHVIERWLENWNGSSNQDNLRPYCQVIVYWLQKRLNKNKA